MKSKGQLPPDARDYIDPKRSAIENFILLNRVCGSQRTLAPLSTLEDKFITLSELELSTLFWRDPVLKARIQSVAREAFVNLDADRVSLGDVSIWLAGAEPGKFITTFLTDIGGYSTEERKKLRNYSRTTFLMSSEDMQAHLQNIRGESFQPAAYAESGYVLRGSIRTDGFRLQTTAFKLNELHCVKYKRLHPDKLSGISRLTSTLGGTDDFLTEIRNVVRTEQDVVDLWNCDPHDIKILGIDLNQAVLVGASAILPRAEPAVQPNTEPSPSNVAEGEVIEVSMTESPSHKYYNLACKQKAVYQPTFKYRRWLEQRKGKPTEGGEFISHIESSLPHRHGPEASIRGYITREKEVEHDLGQFYGNVVLKKHKWNARKARMEEYRLIANRLLQLIGGTMGAKRDAENKVIIGIGLGQFSSKNRLSSLHESFKSYFVKKVSRYLLSATLCYLIKLPLILVLTSPLYYIIRSLGSSTRLYCCWCS